MDAKPGALSPTLIEAAEKLRVAFEQGRIQYALIGGLGVGVRSRPRATKDIDVLLAVPQIQLPSLLDKLSENGFSIDQREVIEGFVQHHMTAFDYRGVRIDWLKPLVPAYQHVLERAEPTVVFDEPMRVAKAEGLILLKLMASRPQDLADIAALLASNRGQLDLAWVDQEWCTMFETSDDRWQQFQKTVREFYEPRPA
jgi:hypothetical protein